MFHSHMEHLDRLPGLPHLFAKLIEVNAACLAVELFDTLDIQVGHASRVECLRPIYLYNYSKKQ